MLDVFVRASSVNLVFPLYPTNLSALIYEWSLSEYQQKAYAWMALSALNICHHHGLMHRDLKPSNMLIDWDGQLKLADFGQARPVRQNELIHESTSSESNHDGSNNGWYSHQVCTRWYRAPELLYGANRYDQSVDVWSLGCVLAEIVQRNPLFAGHSDIEQLAMVHQALGNPPLEWAQSLPDYDKIAFLTGNKESNSTSSWQQRFKNVELKPDLLQIFQKTICYNSRWKTDQLLKCEYFNVFQKETIQLSKLIIPKSVQQRSGPKFSD